MKPLAIVPTYLRSSNDLRVVETCLRTLRETAGDTCDVVVVDDGSPARDLVEGLATRCAEIDADCIEVSENAGFSRTVNHGLQRAYHQGRDAVLVNADIEFGLTPDWLQVMEQQDVSIVGALLLYPGGELIQHGGVFFSNLTREFGHLYHFGPATLAEANVAAERPVTGALMYIHHECLEAIGPFDPTFRMGFEDVDYNVRAWLTGRKCLYQPAVRAIHHESLFRGRQDTKIARWTDESWRRFIAKWGDQNFAEFVPTLL